MFKFLIFLFSQISLSIATIECFPEDFEGPESYKNKALISDYSSQYLEDRGLGALTLVFKKQKSPEHSALVFEYFNPHEQNKLTLYMVHYGGAEEDCCGYGKNMKPIVDGARETLRKVHRAQEYFPVKDIREEKDPLYRKYATWLRPTKFLVSAMNLAEEDSKEGEKASVPGLKKHCVNYVAKIMRASGIEVNFSSFKPNNPSHLRQLVVDEEIREPNKIWGTRPWENFK